MIPQFSINITYYNEPRWLQWWYDTAVKLYNVGFDVDLNIGDDGSMVEPAEDFFEKNPPLPCMRLFRVKQDLGFNSHGTRNLLMKQTRSEWNLLSDIDRRYPDQTLFDILNTVNLLRQGRHYKFQTADREQEQASHNEFIVHVNDFWKTGGYDEEFVNHHFGDRIFLDQLEKHAKMMLIPEWKISYPRGARKVSKSLQVSLTTYPDDNTLIIPANRPSLDPIVKMVIERNKNPTLQQGKPTIQFEWEQVF